MLIVVAVVLTLWLMYLLRQPLTWIFIAGFLAIAVSGPVTVLSRRMRRGFAVAIVYLVLILTPFALIALLVPPIVTQANNLVQNLPEYADEVTRFVNENDRLRQLQDDYDITGRIEEAAGELPSRLGDAAGVLGDIGVGLVNSIFAAVTILVLSIFMLSSGRRFMDAWIREYQPDREEWWNRLFERIGNAIGNYVAGALLQATIAGFTSWIMLVILGVDFALPLAVIVFVLDLIPLVGATLGAIVVGIVTLFSDFPIDTDHLGRLRDRLPAGREQHHPAPDPGPRGSAGPAHRAGLGAVRLRAGRRARGPAGDPGRRRAPDHLPRVPRAEAPGAVGDQTWPRTEPRSAVTPNRPGPTCAPITGPSSDTNSGGRP